MSKFLFSIVVFLVSCASSQKIHSKYNGRKLVWSEEFNYNGLPDSTKWGYDTGGGGFGNNELEYYTKADTTNAVVRDGKLFIKILNQKKENRSYTSARILTKGKADWLYGLIEVRAKLPTGRGLWPAIWMMPAHAEYGKWPTSGEIDIMENVGYNPDSVFTTIHTKSFNHIIGTQKSHGIYLKNSQSDFHLYGIDWNKDRIVFLIDKIPVFTFFNSGKGYEEWPFDKNFFFIINTAVGGNWGGRMGVDNTIFPAEMQIDYIRIYQ
ncbi:MAG: glycoside hydrolase family 16 protein [Bacteroidetes bacterium]|nr:glycoside hydrolase family 16 protein [Bacteroidota bacterium]MBS1756074.1 glycoside hydrolase family 16 protein [Bacteroidota bacterium]